MSLSNTEVNVRLTPRSSRNKIEMQPDGSLKAWVTSAPTDGQANEALCELIAKHLRIGKTSVSIVSGQTNRNKRVLIDGICSEELHRRLGE